MDFDMLFLASPKDTSTKGLIIRSLAAMHEASLVELQRIIKKEFGRALSYQAVRQAVLELEERTAIVKEKKNYQLNPTWVSELQDVSATLAKAVAVSSQVKVLDKQTTQVTLKSLGDLGHFVLFSLEQKYFDLSEGELDIQLDHLWIPFADFLRRDRLRQMFVKNTVNMNIRGKTAGDRVLSQWYKQFGTLRLGVKAKAPCQYIVHGNTVVEIYMVDSLRKKMDEVYQLKGVLKFNIFQQLLDMTHNEHPIQLVITRNKQIAERVRSEIRKHL